MKLAWTVDTGFGPSPCDVPHSWGREVDVRWEGPAVYRTSLKTERDDAWLLFHGVSYAARVWLDGALAATHEGIWDAWAVRLPRGEVDVRVEVTKNGGPTYPVKSVLSGFLPYVWQTFGGIFREVEVVHSPVDPTLDSGPATPRIGVDGDRLTLDGAPWTMRGILSWGWYPDLPHPNPSLETLRQEARAVRSLGFNLVKYCLWLPPHRAFRALEEEGLWAWVELPLWAPIDDPAVRERALAECERIVRQYRHHDRIVAWTCGCELGGAVPHDFRARLVELVRDLTGCPLVRDDSGGAEMYGGDPREYGTFEDYHPYCDLPWFRGVLESLQPGPRTPRPTLLGETDDYDALRVVAGWDRERPDWASPDPALNDRGVRWQYDLPRIVTTSRLAKVRAEDGARALRRDSLRKGRYVRREVTGLFRTLPSLAGYVLTGLRDTPISTSGVLDDDGGLVYHPRGTRAWNGPDVLALIRERRPPWVRGGNRPGWRDPQCHFVGPGRFRVALATETGLSGRLRWWLRGPSPAEGDGWVDQGPGCGEALDLTLDLAPGRHALWVEVGGVVSAWRVWAFERPDWTAFRGWSLNDPLGRLGGIVLPGGPNVVATVEDSWVEEARAWGHATVVLLDRECTEPGPFWRECVQTFADPRWRGQWGAWERLRSVSPDCWLAESRPEARVVLGRLDTRTFAESAYLTVTPDGHVRTTLRPDGGLGDQPNGVNENPAGAVLLAELIRLAEARRG